MCAKWNGDYNNAPIIKRINLIRQVQNGKVSFSGFSLNEYIAVLGSMIIFNEKIENIDKERILRAALFSILGKSVNSKSLISAIIKKEEEFYKTKKTEYIVLTTISVRYHSNLKKINIFNCVIEFLATCPFALEKVEKLIKNHIELPLPTNYTWVIIRINARTVHEAINKATYALDYLRAIWALTLYAGNVSYRSGGRPQPRNSILLGPIKTIHDIAGNVNEDIIWYELDYINQRQPISIEKEWKDMVIRYNKYNKLISKCSYSGMLTDMIVQYIRGLDNCELQKCFVSLWMILEKLTNTTTESYKSTIKRAAFLYKDREYHVQVLTHLKNQRNELIHNMNFHDDEAIINQLKIYAERLICFHLFYGHRFDSLQEVSFFMELPSDIKELNKKMKIIKEAKKFISN